MTSHGSPSAPQPGASPQQCTEWTSWSTGSSSIIGSTLHHFQGQEQEVEGGRGSPETLADATAGKMGGEGEKRWPSRGGGESTDQLLMDHVQNQLYDLVVMPVS